MQKPKTINPNALVIRSASLDDVDRLLEMSELVGLGMTSMPRDRDAWLDKINRSVKDFDRAEPLNDGDIYFMVMEDTDNEKIVGCGAVYAGIGMRNPFYSYKLSTISSYSKRLNITVHARTLSLVNDFIGKTEIGSLFLLPEYRVAGIGKFLSRSRFLLLADFPERFSEIIFAEMRGWLDNNGGSPFWRHLGSKFFGISFSKADRLNAVEGHQFISDLMPKYPVYLDLLPEEAQDVVGKEHSDTSGALHILKKESFRFSDYVDIFDAGPTITTTLHQIKTVVDSKIATIAKIVPASSLNETQKYIISNGQLRDYRLIYAVAKISKENSKQISSEGEILITISTNSAKALKTKVGDQLRIVEH